MTTRRILASSALGGFLVLLAPRWVAGTVPGGGAAPSLVTMECLLGLALGALAVSGRPLIEALAGPLLAGLALLAPFGAHASPLGAGALAGLSLVAAGAALGDVRRTALGAALGVVLWMLVAAAEAPPAVWFAVAGILLVLAAARPFLAAFFAAAAIAVVAAAEPPARWSPYHAVAAAGQVFVDGEPLEEAPGALARLFPRRSVLVLGGSPAEVAALVSAGAVRVLAVELDPAIARLTTGAIVADPRAFLERTEESFDLVLLGAHETQRASSLAATFEGFRLARRHLAPGGACAASVSWLGPWRTLCITMSEAFQEDLRVHSMGAMATFVAGGRGAGERDALPAPYITVPPALATDDWPHAELADRVFPRGGWLPFAAVAAAFLVLAATLGVRPSRDDATIVLLGCALALVVARSLAAAALALGATWEVRGLVLLVALGAAALASVVHPRPRIAKWALVVVLALVYGVPLDLVPRPAGPAVALAIAAIPVFLASALIERRAGALAVGLALAVIVQRASVALGDGALAVVALAVVAPALILAASGRPPR